MLCRPQINDRLVDVDTRASISDHKCTIIYFCIVSNIFTSTLTIASDVALFTTFEAHPWLMPCIGAASFGLAYI